MFPLYQGNWPGNVNRDAKYVVRESGGAGPRTTVTYHTADGETWLASTRDHPELVEMVNSVKRVVGGGQNGPFYITEHRQVIVPVGNPVRYYLAGEYTPDLTFDFEGHHLTGRPVNWNGQPLRPGDVWTGPHPGIPYVLAAGGDDVYYRKEVRPDVTRKIKLSDFVGAESARLLASSIRAVKGWTGGVVYINECRSMFAPITRQSGLEYLYVGALDEDSPWFPKPEASAE